MKEENKKKEMPECCRQKKGIVAGISSGIIPHIGCIVIILLAILGVAAANTFFIKFLFNLYYLYIVFFLSIGIATLSAFFYLRRFSDRKIKSHWRYLLVLYSSVIIVNLAMIYFVFPYIADASSRGLVEGEMLKLNFEIPCSGHAPLVISELEKTDGINSVKYISGQEFEVYYNPEKINKEQILNQDVCREFNAEEGK